MSSRQEKLEELLGYNFNNKGLLQTALIHSSFAHENNIRGDNERLEFLGDAVIHLALTEFLMETYPDNNEGELSTLRSYCESESFLYERAKDIDLGSFIMFGKGETISGGQYKESLLANTFEAVIAAVHLDGGFKKSRDLVLKLLNHHVINAYEDKLYLDIKSALQKYTQKYYNKTLPEYSVLQEEGEDHKKIFTVSVSVNGDSATGKGRTKKAAEKDAAMKLYKILIKNVK